MGSINDYSDIRLKQWCIHCGTGLDIADCSNDHIPSKFLLKKPYPKDLYTTKICKSCNASFSEDESYCAKIVRWIRSKEISPDRKINVMRIMNVMVKNARGHIMYELGERAEGIPFSIQVTPLQNLDAVTRTSFEAVNYGHGWPEVGCRLMDRLITGNGMRPDGWIDVQSNTYRYATFYEGDLSVKMVIEEYLAAEVTWIT